MFLMSSPLIHEWSSWNAKHYLLRGFVLEMKGEIKATFLPDQLWRCQNDPSDWFNKSIPKILAFHMSIKSCMWFLPSYCIQQDWAIQKEISSTQKVERQQRRLSARKRYWTVLNKLKHWQETNRDDWDDCCQCCDWSVIMC